MEARGWISIVASAIVLAAPVSAAAAPTERVAVLVVPASAPVFRSAQGAHGLLVPGQGSEVSRRTALASLVRGEVENSLVGGIPGGEPLISLARKPGRITFYVSLPPPGRHHNVVRYPIAVVGPGYGGILVSGATRLPGLVSIADVAPSVRALERGERPRIRSEARAEPLRRLAKLDRRLTHAHDARIPAMYVLAGLMAGLGALALATRSPTLGRAAFLAAPACITAAVVLSAAGSSSPWVVGVAGAAAALVGGTLLRPRWPLALALAAFFAFLFTVMWVEPGWNILAIIGPHPDGGGRFYGITNQVETLLLAPALVLGTLAGTAVLPAIALVLVAGIGISRIGADGGGLVVFLAGFLVLGLRLRRVPARRAAAAVAVAAGAALALVGIDAATGGSSHVTHAVGGGPGSLLGDLGHRLHLSAESIVSTWNNAVLFSLGVAALVWLALQRPRLALLDAMLLALAVSLLVNDTPADIAGWGGLSALVLRVWLIRTRERASPLE